jgi:hypothetical protein
MPCRYVVCIILAFTAIHMQADDRELFIRTIKLSTGKGTVYQLFKEVSEQTGYSFIYDSRIIDNNKRVNIKKGEYLLIDAIMSIAGNYNLTVNVLGNHILLRLINEPTDDHSNGQKENNSNISLRGSIFDGETREPIQFVNVGITGTTIGTVSNLNGDFQLIIPSSTGSSKIKMSHIGYETREIEVSLLDNQSIEFYLNPKTIPLQEILISATNPTQVLNDMIRQKRDNYSLAPVYMTSFYREGIDYKKKNIDLTEAVLQVYKTGFESNSGFDQAKLIKKRRATNQQMNDTIFPRMKSGIGSCLVLDIIKEMPEFIDPNNNSRYSYSFDHITTIDNRIVNVIAFKQKASVNEPLYMGNLYIDDQTKALIEIQFEINPKHIEKATHHFVVKKTRALTLSLQEAKYIVSYKPASDGIYYINHIRGDIVFKVRKKNHLFNSLLHFWFETVTCKIDTKDVKNIPRNERLSPETIFSETNHTYDQNFWENFNLILPEERLVETMINNLNEVIINSE